MSQTLRARLVSAQQAHAWLTAAYATLKPYLLAEQVFDITIKPETRSTAQNRLLHATIGEIASQIEWAGKKRGIDTWRRLMTAAWLRARGESIEFLPALDGCGVDIVFRRTSKLTIAEMSELIEFVLAWKSEHMVDHQK